MRLITWNCCWKLKGEKLTALLAEQPDIAVIQECSADSLVNLPDGYEGRFLGGAEGHGLGVVFRPPYSVHSVKSADAADFFSILEVVGPITFRLIAAWNCPQQGLSYVANLHQFLDSHSDWFDNVPIVFAGDLNSQNGAAFDKGKLRHADLDERLLSSGLIDVYTASRGITNPKEREATYRHQRKSDKPFHFDYIYAPVEWIPKITGFMVGPPGFWSSLSDHSPLTLCVSEA